MDSFLKTESAMRLAKRLAMMSALSRRQAEEAILRGEVQVDGVTIQTPVFLVEKTNCITLKGQILKEPDSIQIWRFYKPIETIVTRVDPQQRTTIYDCLPQWADDQRCISVGRLDYLSEGLLLLTNTPKVASFLERSDWVRCYQVWVRGRLHTDLLSELQQGCCIDGVFYDPCRIYLLDQQQGCFLLEFHLKEGKNREIRKMCSFAHLFVLSLTRISFGPFELDDLQSCQYEEVPQDIIVSLGLHNLSDN
jgi:23S rRNA pseudouridine2605 synthase